MAKAAKKKSTKKPTAKQLAARKKFAAMAKARAKKTTVKKAVKPKRTAAQKKARKAKNTIAGYYPNPLVTLLFAAKVKDGKPSGKKYFLNKSGKLDTSKTGAAIFHDGDLSQLKMIAKSLVKRLPAGYGLFTDKVKGSKK